jgi:hypothetical protein
MGINSKRLVVLSLAVVLVGPGVLLATSDEPRIRWHVWRMQSDDPKIAADARLRLLRIPRPAIDPMLIEVIATHAVQCYVDAPSFILIAKRIEGDEYEWVAKVTGSGPHFLERRVLEIHSPGELLAERRHVLIVGTERAPHFVLPIDDDIERPVIAAIRERLSKTPPRQDWSLPPRGRRAVNAR